MRKLCEYCDARALVTIASTWDGSIYGACLLHATQLAAWEHAPTTMAANLFTYLDWFGILADEGIGPWRHLPSSALATLRG